MLRSLYTRGLAAALVGVVLDLPTNAAAADSRFARLSSAFIQHQYELDPLDGVALGWHEYDGKFVVPTRRQLEEETAWLRREQIAFRDVDAARLSAVERADRDIVLAFISGQLWSLTSQRAPFHNPMTYSTALDVSVYLKRAFKPLPARVRDITAILKSAPALFAAARANLDAVLPAEYIETAIEEAEGTASFIGGDVAKEVGTLSDERIKREFTVASTRAQAELTEYIAWLKRERLPHADHSFAIGRDSFVAMLRGELIDYTPEQILAIGLAELRKEQDRFNAAAREIDPALEPAEVYKAIAADHPTAESLLPDTRKTLEGIRQFVIDHHLVSIPSEVRAQVAETLPPFRATTFASMDTPGPFEQVATEAYYYVTPVDASWPAAQKDEWLSAFNYYTTDAVSIHEVYPGHYIQFLAMHASHASDTSKIFGSYAYIEGWAHYCEHMVLQAGYMQPVDPSQATPAARQLAAKYRLAQSGEALLRLCRLCCSIQLHTQGMTVEQATRFFTANCHYEEKPSHSEAMRGTYDPGYLYYTLGKLQILKLREDWRKQEGAAYSLERFHDEFLSHGMPPIRVLREQLLHDPADWPNIL